jgi:protein phosphatase
MVRSLNEDSLITVELSRIQQSIGQPLGLYVVADGMGGHAAGEIASGTIVNTMAQKALSELMPVSIAQDSGQDRVGWLREAVQQANVAVYDLRKSAETDMGSTLVAALLEGTQAYIAHVGDSRAYVIDEEGIRRITTDHSLVERLIATNQITRDEARYHPQRNVIYRTVGDKKTVDVDVSVHPLRIDDYLLLCSDGLSGMVEDQFIRQIVAGAESPQAACDKLIEAANAAGGEDNITVIILQVVET